MWRLWRKRARPVSGTPLISACLLIAFTTCGIALAAPEDAELLKAGAFFDKGDVTNALPHFKKAVELNPKSAYAHQCLGVALGRLKKDDEAIAEFKAALKLIPNYAPSLNSLAHIKEEQLMDYNGCIPLYKRALTGDNISTEETRLANAGLMRAYTRLKQYKEALPYAAVFIKMSPPGREQGGGYLYRSDIYQSMNQVDLAAADLERAALQFPKDPIAYMSLGKLYFRAQQYDKAAKAWSSALTIDPQSSYCLLRRGWCYQKLNKSKEALADFNKSLGIHPEDGSLEGRAQVYKQMKEYKKAIADYSQLIKSGIADKAPTYYKARAELYKLTGEKALATKDLLKSKDKTLDLLDEFR